MVARRPRWRRVGAAVPAVLPHILLALALLGCDAISATPSAAPTSSSGPVGSSLPEPSTTATDAAADSVLAMAAGVWRAIPVDPSRSFSAPFEAGCRAKEPALAGLLTALVDVRGASIVNIVFAKDRVAYLCRVGVASPTTPESITKLDVPAVALAPDGIDIVLYKLLGSGDSATTVLVGRVGSKAAHVIAGFDDEHYIFGAQSGGWYAMWWPGTPLMAGVAATDRGHVVLTEVEGTRQ